MQRQRADKVKANAVTGGGVEVAVRQLVVQLDAEEGSMAAALGALAISAAQMADAGNPMAPGHLSKILDAVDEAAPEKDDTDKFSLLWDVVLAHPRAITREGVNPESKLGRALIKRGEVLPTKFPPPWYPPGWSGTAISGSPEEYAERIGWPWEDPVPLRFWTRDQLECPACGHEFLPPGYGADNAEHRQLQRAEIEGYQGRRARPPEGESK